MIEGFRGRTTAGGASRSRRGGSALLVLGLVAACNAGPVELGRPLDPAAAIPLSALLARQELPRDEVLVAGEIGEVCRESGCWFVLRDRADGDGFELFVDLATAASFTLPRRLRGRPVVVAGRLLGEPPDLKLHAVAVTAR